MALFENFLKSVKQKSIGSLGEASTSRDPRATAVSRIGQAISSVDAGEFEEHPVDLQEISRAYFTDSYIRRAVDTKAGLVLKNGWELVGKNDAATEYVWTRLKLMAEGTGQSVDDWLQEITDNVCLYSNAYVVKARGPQLPAGINAVGYSGNQPIAGYFVLPSQEIQISRDENGEIESYQQVSESGGDEIEFSPEDVVHIVHHKPTGRAYGIPLVFNVLDDVKLLRQIEENVARLIHRNLFPLTLYKVGIAQHGFEATDQEIEELRENIRNLPSDGALVVPERHDIKVVGSQGQAIDVSGYLKYFRERVFSGLGVSDTIMGVSGTANRSTSDNQSADLVDAVKDFQRTLSNALKHHIINEILFEGGFDPVMNEDDEVDFIFSEIDFDAKIKRENHVVQKFMQNVISFPEMRQEMGMDMEVDTSEYYYYMFGDGQGGVTSETDDSDNDSNNSNGVNNGDGTDTGVDSTGNSNPEEKRKKASVTESNNDLTPNRQTMLRGALKIDNYSSRLEKQWRHAKSDARAALKRGDSPDKIISITTGVLETVFREELTKLVEHSVNHGFQRGCDELKKTNLRINATDIKSAVRKYEKRLKPLIKDTSNAIKKYHDSEEADMEYEHLFTANEFRIRFNIQTIAFEAFNFGMGTAGIKAGRKRAHVLKREDACSICKNARKTVSLVEGWHEEMPPHHINCGCILTYK